MADPTGLGTSVRRRADQGAVRRNNLALVLRLLRDQGSSSRARIAVETGLNKATVSSLVAELVERGLVREGEIERSGGIGRPSQAVELDGRAVVGLGAEVNVEYAAVIALDLAGGVVFERRIPIDVTTLEPGEVLDRLEVLLRQAVAATDERGAMIAGLTLAIPGLIDVGRGVVALAPNLDWHDLPVVDELRRRLADPPWPIGVDNDANLSALGEHVQGEVDAADLVYVTGAVGVGGGVIAGGELLRGAEGFSGEVGHLPLDPHGYLCGCGRRGCWETMVGFAALLRLATDDDDPVRDRSLDLEQRLEEIARRAEAGDLRTRRALHEVGVALGVGASVLVNLLNPRAIVLGGYFARLGSYLRSPLEEELLARTMAPEAGGARVVMSKLGFTAAVRGGAQRALDNVMADPTVVPVGPTAAGG